MTPMCVVYNQENQQCCQNNEAVNQETQSFVRRALGMTEHRRRERERERMEWKYKREKRRARKNERHRSRNLSCPQAISVGKNPRYISIKTNVLLHKFMNYTTKKYFFLRIISHNRPTDRDRLLRETYVGKRNMLRRR